MAILMTTRMIFKDLNKCFRQNMIFYNSFFHNFIHQIIQLIIIN